MGVLIQLKAGPAIITQAEISALIALRNQVRSLKEMRDQQTADMLDRLLAGSTVEAGTHTAGVKHLRKRGALITRLNIY